MARLRKDLKDDGYDVDENLKYFFVSEYGGITHRPHYHCLFFITFDIDVNVFRSYVSRAWYLGIIDDVKTVSKRVVNGEGALHYVAKYVVKDDDYVKTLDSLKYKMQDEIIGSSKNID